MLVSGLSALPEWKIQGEALVASSTFTSSSVSTRLELTHGWGRTNVYVMRNNGVPTPSPPAGGSPSHGRILECHCEAVSPGQCGAICPHHGHCTGRPQGFLRPRSSGTKCFCHLCPQVRAFPEHKRFFSRQTTEFLCLFSVHLED